MIELSQNFSTDFDAIAAVLQSDYSGLPIAMGRFGDGEYAILRNMAHVAKSDRWRWDGQPHELQQSLHRSLVAGCELSNYYVGISAANHHPRAHDWYKHQLEINGVPMNRVTFASLFIFANYERFLAAVGKLDRFVTVGGSKKCDFQTPRSPLDKSWTLAIQCLAVELRNIDYTDAILVSAGPWASVLVHEYWRITDRCRNRRNTIIDVGSAVDEMIRGRRTRKYHDEANRQRHWVPKFH